MFIFCIFMFWRKVDCSVKKCYIRTVLRKFLKKTVRKYNVVFGFPVFFILEKSNMDYSLSIWDFQHPNNNNQT